MSMPASRSSQEISTVIDGFSSMKITVIAAPCDMRKGYNSLSVICGYLNINLRKGEVAVVFMSGSRRLAKIVWSDGSNGYCLSCYPHDSAYKKLLSRVTDPVGNMPVSVEELKLYLSGRPLLHSCEPL